MERRRLGSSGPQVSAIGLGCMSIGIADVYTSSAQDEVKAIELIHRALDLGMNFLDSANIYGDSEIKVGKALARPRCRWQSRECTPCVRQIAATAWGGADRSLLSASCRSESTNRRNSGRDGRVGACGQSAPPGTFGGFSGDSAPRPQSSSDCYNPNGILIIQSRAGRRSAASVA